MRRFVELLAADLLQVLLCVARDHHSIGWNSFRHCQGAVPGKHANIKDALSLLHADQELEEFA